MDAKRLEELTEWCRDEERDLLGKQRPRRAQNFADLARCAAAWAKVERVRLTVAPAWSARVDDGSEYQPCCYGSTAIAAVEAAPEVKP